MMAATPALAGPVLVTYTGHVSSGYDQAGEFGAVGADLTGKAFVAKYLFDPIKGSYTYENANYRDSYGFGSGSPLLWATLTLEGHTSSIAGTYYSQIYGYSSDDLRVHYVYASDRSVNGSTDVNKYLYNQIYDYSGSLPDEVIGDGPISISLNGMYANSGYYGNYIYNYGTGQYLQTVQANLVNEFLSVQLGGVPEPATWALMVLGFGAVGGALRRRRNMALSIRFA